MSNKSSEISKISVALYGVHDVYLACLGKGKVKLSLCLTKHYAMNTYGGVVVQIHVLLPSALIGGEWSASRLCRFIPGKRAPGTNWIGGWVGPRAGLGDMRK
jgi:hypothetical protein